MNLHSKNVIVEDSELACCKRWTVEQHPHVEVYIIPMDVWSENVAEDLTVSARLGYDGMTFLDQFGSHHFSKCSIHDRKCMIIASTKKDRKAHPTQVQLFFMFFLAFGGLMSISINYLKWQTNITKMSLRLWARPLQTEWQENFQKPEPSAAPPALKGGVAAWDQVLNEELLRSRSRCCSRKSWGIPTKKG